jgi:hypothetical protein
MIAYVCSVVGIFRLVRSSLAESKPSLTTSFAPWFAALVFASNPSLLYLQSTAMTEPLYLALFIWSITHLLEFAGALQSNDFDAARASLLWCSLCLAACTMTRYDGWIAMATICLAVFTLLTFHIRNDARVPRSGRVLWDMAGSLALKVSLLRFLLVCAAGPLFWLSYNTAVYKNPIEFANGPYSAKAIEQRIVQAPHPGTGNPVAAEIYFMRAVEMNLAADISTAKWWLLLALAGSLAIVLHRGHSRLLLILWIPLPFYALSIAYSGVPVFVPDWWPFGIYNLRYGLQLLPAVAVFCALLLHHVLLAIPIARARQGIALVAATLCLWGSALAWHHPASLLEATGNMQGRVTLQERLAQELVRLPAQSSILMALRDYPGAPQRAGVALRRTINENDQRLAIRPHDPEGLWQQALRNPAQFVDYVVGFAGDPVAASAEAHHLPVVFSVEVAGQPRATIYRAR